MTQELRIKCSPEQEDVIVDHVLYDGPLGLQPDERAWMLYQARKIYPDCRIQHVILDIENAEWILTIQTKIK